MIISWSIDINYAVDYDFETEVHDEDLKECKTREEKMDLIETCIQADFENSVTFTWNPDKYPI